MEAHEVLWPNLKDYAADGGFQLEGWMLDEAAAVCEALAGLAGEVNGDPARLLARVKSGYAPLWVHATFREARDLGLALPAPIATPDRLHGWYVHLAERFLGAASWQGGGAAPREGVAPRG